MPGIGKQKEKKHLSKNFPDFNLERFFTKNILIIYYKNLTDFHKMVETGVDPHLILLF